MRHSKTQAIAFALFGVLSLSVPAGPSRAQGGTGEHRHHGNKPWFGKGRGDDLRMDSTQDGDGSIRVSGRKDRDLDSARVTLAPGGQATVVLLNNGGREQETFTGSWRPADDNGNVPLGLTGQFGREPVNIGGNVNLRERDPGKFDRITLSGRAGRRGVSIHFTAK